MGLIPQVTCRRCGEYSAMRRRCPKCSTRRVQNSRRAPGTTPSAVKGTAANKERAIIANGSLSSARYSLSPS